MSTRHRRWSHAIRLTTTTGFRFRDAYRTARAQRRPERRDRRSINESAVASIRSAACESYGRKSFFREARSNTFRRANWYKVKSSFDPRDSKPVKRTRKAARETANGDPLFLSPPEFSFPLRSNTVGVGATISEAVPSSDKQIAQTICQVRDEKIAPLYRVGRRCCDKSAPDGRAFKERMARRTDNANMRQIRSY